MDAECIIKTYFKPRVNCNRLLNGYLKTLVRLGDNLGEMDHKCLPWAQECGSLCATLVLSFMLAKAVLKYFCFCYEQGILLLFPIR